MSLTSRLSMGNDSQFSYGCQRHAEWWSTMRSQTLKIAKTDWKIKLADVPAVVTLKHFVIALFYVFRLHFIVVCKYTGYLHSKVPISYLISFIDGGQIRNSW